MHPLESVAGMVEFAGKNIAHHLEFIPEDKLAWQPEPTAKSVLQIVHHVSYFASGMVGMLSGGEFTPDAGAAPTDRASAQELIRSSSARYANALREVDPARLGTTVRVPLGEFPLVVAGTMPAFDMMHHHGQIAYIQTLLGDTEEHFAL